jgi:hypothetical protein
MATQTISSSAYITGIARLNSSAWIYAKKQSLNSVAFIKEPETSIICDGIAVNDIIEEFGTTIWLRVVTKSFADEYATPTEYYSDTEVKAMVMRYSSSDMEVREGIFKSGEITFSFQQSDEAKVKPGNRILYANDWYEIREVIKQPLVQTVYYLYARVQKI